MTDVVIIDCEENHGAITVVAGTKKGGSCEEVLSEYLLQGYEIVSVISLGGTRTRYTLVQRK
jgi:hypothetical protein